MANITVCDECSETIVSEVTSHATYYATNKIRIEAYFHLREIYAGAPDMCRACKRKLIKQWAEDDEVWS